MNQRRSYAQLYLDLEAEVEINHILNNLASRPISPATFFS